MKDQLIDVLLQKMSRDFVQKNRVCLIVVCPFFLNQVTIVQNSNFMQASWIPPFFKEDSAKKPRPIL